MSHERRKELEDTLTHAINYVWRFIKQSLSNLWQTLKGQQIIQLSVCAIVALGYNIHLGIIEWDKASINIQAVMYFCLTLFILVMLVSAITAPFHLDREQKELVAEKEDKITDLQRKIESVGEPKTNLIKPEKKSLLPKVKSKAEPIVECKKIYSVKVDVSPENDYEVMSGGQGLDKLLLADFTYKRTNNSHQKIYLRAEIKVDNLSDNVPVHTIKGVWSRNVDEYREFIADDVWSVVIGVIYRDKVLLLYEHRVKDLWHLGYEPELDPHIFRIDGANFDITVRLIGDQTSEILLNKSFKFGLSLEPDFSFKKIN